MLFTFSILAQKHHFWANQVKNIKIFTLSQTLILKLIRRCRIQWYCYLCLFQTGNTLFGRFWSKNSKMSILAEFWYLGQFKYTKFNGAVYFFCFRLETPVLAKFGTKRQKKTNRLIEICRFQCCLYLFPFQTGNTLFGQISFKISKLSV